MAGLYTPLFGDACPPRVSATPIWMSNQGAYENHQTKYEGNNVDEAKAALEAAGYVARRRHLRAPDDGR